MPIPPAEAPIDAELVRALVDAESLHRRARGWALMMAAVMLQHEPSDPMRACGIHALERLESE